MNEYGQIVLQFGAASTSLDEARLHIQAFRERREQIGHQGGFFDDERAAAFVACLQ